MSSIPRYQTQSKEKQDRTLTWRHRVGPDNITLAEYRRRTPGPDGRPSEVYRKFNGKTKARHLIGVVSICSVRQAAEESPSSRSWSIQRNEPGTKFILSELKTLPRRVGKPTSLWSMDTCSTWRRFVSPDGLSAVGTTVFSQVSAE